MRNSEALGTNMEEEERHALGGGVSYLATSECWRELLTALP